VASTGIAPKARNRPRWASTAAIVDFPAQDMPVISTALIGVYRQTAPKTAQTSFAVADIRLGLMVNPTYTVKALDQSTWAAFAALVERNNGIFGGCWCMGFHPDLSRTDAAQNRAAKEQRVREGQAHAALVFDEGECVGWCQFGVPGEVPRIKNRAAYEKGPGQARSP
jgi:hypothetical protein